MIEKFEDLGLDLKDSEDQINQKLKEKLNISLLEMKQSLSKYVIDKAEQLAYDLINIVPFGDYDKLIEDQQGMISFLKEEAHKSENWELNYIDNMLPEGFLKFSFVCKAIDEGDTFAGMVFVNYYGKIKHAFAQGSS